MRSPFRPLPGSGPPPRGLFIDRWGTLLELPPQGTPTRFDPLTVSSETLNALFHAGQAGWNLYLLGNEDAVAFGRLALEAWERLERDLLAHLRAHGIAVRRCYACTDNPQGKAPHNRDSVFLLPNTGALYHAAQTDGIVLDQSWVIGDSTLELVAGWRAGCRLAGVHTGMALGDGEYPVDPELVGSNLAAAVRHITAREGVPRRSLR